MQSSITSFFKKPGGITPKSPVNMKKSNAAPSPKSTVGVKKPNTKRTNTLSPNALESLEEEVSSSPMIRAKIEANRASARLKRITSLNVDLSTQQGLETSIEPTWRTALCETLKQSYWSELVLFVQSERKSNSIYPPPSQTFSAFNHSTFQRTRVVIIGQDPYHGQGQAHGMCFSVPDGITPPPSLVNIFRELGNDIPGFVIPKSGCLEKWANQGVLLLNSVLTVKKSMAASHANRGWERFTDAVVRALGDRDGKSIVFLLWGGYAKKKGAGINRNTHCVLESVHPSPLSANRGGWFGNKHFSKANQFLMKTGQDSIDWNLP